jgi:hypothetical protein
VILVSSGVEKKKDFLLENQEKEKEKEKGSAASPQTGLPAFSSDAEKKSPRQKRSRKGEALILAGVILLIIDAFLYNIAVFTSLEVLGLDGILVLGIALIIAGIVIRKVKLHRSREIHSTVQRQGDLPRGTIKQCRISFTVIY